MRRPIFSPRGFTLIELLVVVAIIALLISILLPALRAARDQGKLARCLSNQRQLMTATTQYLTEFDDNFPFLVTQAGNWLGICSWTFGGKTSSDHWRTDHDGVFFIEGRDRPFNKYLLGGPCEPDLHQGNTLIRRTEVPVLQCPADRTSSARRWTVEGLDVQSISSYDDTGASYHYNLQAMFEVELFGDRDPWYPPYAWPEIGQAMVREVFRRHSGTFVMFLEDPMGWGLRERIPEMGNHGKFNMHAISFLDGHAAHRRVDTRGYCGPGWSAIVPSWVKTPMYAPTPAHYYLWLMRNCNPPRD